MNQYYNKIDLNLSDLDIDRIKGDPWEFYGHTFLQYVIKDTNYLNDLIKDRIQFGIEPQAVFYTEIIDTGVMIPHVDLATAVLNYYIESGDAITVFWEIVGQAQTRPLSSNRNGTVEHQGTMEFDIKDLRFAEKMCAQDHEAYLLNTGRPHSINKKPSKPNRKMIRWLWHDVAYEDVLASIHIPAGRPR